MEDNIYYCLEKFENAVRSLAIGKGDVRARLESAFMSLHTVRPSDLPDDLQEDFRWVLDKLTTKAPRHRSEGRIQATLAQMQNRTGANIAERIVSIWERLRVLSNRPKEKQCT